MVATLPSHGGHVVAAINPAGSVHVVRTSLHAAPFKKHHKPAVRQDLTAAELPVGARGLSAPIANTAAIALSGSHTHAKRPPTHQARREAHKAVKHLTKSDLNNAGVSRPALAGAVLQLVARVFTAVGLIIQRTASANDTKAMMWRVGLAVYMASAVPDMLSYLLAPQAVLTVLSSVEPVLVSVLAAVLLPQDAALITSQQSLATAMCVAGTLGTVLFAPVGFAALHGAAANEVTTSPIWGITHGAERLFEPSGAHRLMVYLVVVVPLLIYIARQVHKHKSANYTSQGVSSFWLMVVAATSMALQRLTLAMLGVSLYAVHWEPWLVLSSPTIIGTAICAVVCMWSCIYHVCQGVSEAPPHIFVPLYCAMSTLVQLFHSMVIMREFRDETTEKVLLTLGCAAVSFFGILRLSTSQGQKAGFLTAGSAHAFNTLEPLLFDPPVGGATKPRRTSVSGARTWSFF